MNFLYKLEEADIRSDDLEAGEYVRHYLGGWITKAELRKSLKERRKEVARILKGVDKLLAILPNCPSKVKQ